MCSMFLFVAPYSNVDFRWSSQKIVKKLRHWRLSQIHDLQFPSIGKYNMDDTEKLRRERR